MNILFYSVWDISPQKGGTERITSTLCTEFRREGHKCYLVYKTNLDPNFELCEFDGKFKIGANTSDEDIIKYLLDNKINVIHIQSNFLFVRRIRKIRDINHLSLKIIFSHHFEPGWEERSVPMSDILLDVRQAITGFSKLVHIIRLFLYPINRLRISYLNHKYYRLSYENTDNVVLLSKYFFNKYMQYMKMTDVSKLRSIPNALSFNEFLPFIEISKKEKIVLIVSRLEETQKRISSALKIWVDLYSYTSVENWKLYIIGAGRYNEYYKKIVKKHRLTNVFFEGIRDPKPYYVKASLFMMTSESEGWGLTLTEAMQFGCVPIAFDNYDSLKDIIINDYNGVLVSRNQQSDYVDAMLSLMIDHSCRNLLAHQAINFSRKFAIKEVAHQWLNLYKE